MAQLDERWVADLHDIVFGQGVAFGAQPNHVGAQLFDTRTLVSRLLTFCNSFRLGFESLLVTLVRVAKLPIDDRVDDFGHVGADLDHFFDDF